MTVGFPEDLPNQPNFDPINPAVMDAMDGVVQGRQQIIEAATDYRNRPIKLHQKRIIQYGQQWSSSVGELISSVVEYDDSNAPDILAGLMVAENYQRALAFARITNNYKVFDPHKSGPTAEQLRSSIIDEYNENEIDEMTAHSIFVAHATADIAEFTKLIGDGHKARTIEIARVIGKTSLDIAKISAGVLLALGIHSRRK